jgi:hypothetical protein
MVHALERARRHLAADGVLICIQPHRTKRPFIAVRTARHREPIGALINPVFQPLIDSANAAIASVLDKRLLSLIRAENHQFRVRIANPTQLRLYMSAEPRPPRFPAGGRKRLLEVWRSSPLGAWIEVTEHMTVIGMRAGRR